MNIEIEDYLDEVSTRVLVQELQKRPAYEFLTRENVKNNLDWFEGFDKLNTIERVKLVLNLRPYATKAEIINEINEL